jgi:eukaryotic translation initiation factor 2C
MDPQTVTAMVTERLQAWEKTHQSNDGLPLNIVYFRDGVSEGHYSKVQQVELPAIYEAYDKKRAERGLPHTLLKLTAVIVTKRHHTYFYPIDKVDKDTWGNNNCMPGTCVDQLVTSPYYQDFYLQSHIGLQGTAHPTHHFALQNDIPDTTLEGLRELVSFHPLILFSLF